MAEKGASGELATYRSMRRFADTPEPAGEGDETPSKSRRKRGGKKPRFVVQEHHATSMHWDFRLERDGVLVSWAVPKGVPPDPRVNHLAVHTEDHPLSYFDFEGSIPEGNYGAGKVVLWDQGTYEEHKWEEREVMVTLHGDRARGRYVLFRTGGKNWMIHRMDPAEDADRDLMPEHLDRVLPARGRMPSGASQWSFEVDWGGMPVLVYSEGGRARIETADGADVSASFPELRDLGRALGATAVVLEGQLAGPDVEERMGLGESANRRRGRSAPVAFVATDVLWVDGHDVTAAPFRERAAVLDGLRIDGPAWRTNPRHEGEGKALRAAAAAQGLPAVVARRLDSGYDSRSIRRLPAPTA